MLGEKVHNFLFGYVDFTARDGFSDFFLSECRRQRINIENVRLETDGISARVRLRDYPRALNAAALTGMRIQALRRGGIPHIAHYCVRRLGIPIGLLAAIVISAFLSSCVWSVEVTGNEKISEESLVELLAELGVKRGAFIAGIDSAEVEKAVENRLDGVLWIAVNIVGSRVFADVRETIETPEITDGKKYVNIIARAGGEIVSADILEGDGTLAPGMPVVKGDLLVSGVVPLAGGGSRFVHAKANILARTKSTFSSSTALSINVQKISSYKDRYQLYVFGLKLPLGAAGKENRTVAEYLLKNSESVFPVGVIRERYTSFENKTLELSVDEAALICFSDFAVGALERYKDCELVSREMFVSCDKELIIGAEYICIESIGEEQEFSVDSQQ